MKNNRLGLAAAPLMLGLLSALPLSAQLHENINVEGKYVPDVIRIDRVNAFPKGMTYTLPTARLNYEAGGVAAGFSPELMPLPATGWNATRRVDSSRGYLEAGAGSWLNSTLSAGYRIIDTPSTLFGVRLQHNSASLWQPRLSEATEDVKQWRYDESVGVYASHLFEGVGRLDAALDYHVGVFDYYGYMNPHAFAGDKLTAPTQTLNDVAFKADWHSPHRAAPALSYYVGARVRHFGFRALPLPGAFGTESVRGNRETDLGFNGGVRMPWDNGSSIGLDARLDLLFYAETPDRPNNYALATLTPYYRFTKGLLDVKLGADLDFAVRAGLPGHRYSFLHVAPEVRFALQSGGIGLWLNATGGSQLNTLASLREHDYYMMPALTNATPTYTPLDVALGVNLGPFSGFSLGVEGGYKVSRHVRLGGWYQAWMNYGSAPLPAFAAGMPSGAEMLYSLDTEGINLHGFHVGAKIGYEPSRVLSLRASASYQPQNGKKGFFNGYDRPRILANAEATVRPISPLSITLGYDYRGVRTAYTRMVEEAPSVVVNGDDGTRLVGMRLADLCLLNLSASWAFTPSFSVWVQADNLLNRHDAVLPCLPAQGVVVTGGVKLLF